MEEEVGSSEKASLSEKVVLVLLAVEAGAVKEGSGFLPSRRVPSRRVQDLAIKAGAGAGRPGLGFAPCVAGSLVSRSIRWQYNAGVGSGSPSFGGGSKLWRRQQALEVSTRQVRSHNLRSGSA